MTDVRKVVYYVEIPTEMWIDALPITTMGWSPGDRAAEYLRYKQPVHSGPSDWRNPATMTENLPRHHSWDYGWPTYLDDPVEHDW